MNTPLAPTGVVTPCPSNVTLFSCLVALAIAPACGGASPNGRAASVSSALEVNEASGINARGYGMGVATGDFNNDGCVDLYLTNLGPNQLYRNNCDGTFTDVSKQSGTEGTPALGGPSWSVSASFLDYDRDGW